MALLLTFPARVHAQANPEWAVVRIKSHGASGVVIESGPGKSIILSCAHMFDSQASLTRPLKIDGWQQPNAPKGQFPARLLRYSKGMDLSLIEIDNGPFFAVKPAPRGYKPASRLVSLGYDEMAWPTVKRTAHYLGASATTIYTREPPWHGRSGGALVDPSFGYLIGIVQGYELPYPYGKGLYVSLETIHRFLAGGQQPRPQFHSPFPLSPSPFH